ncbi:receptor-type tyrosine-protein phosphatase epsilon-like [Mya arenaria]|uniref:receptor-type tyrosine-protein phosphatase epsilon-like n=1 Tax=Mya arenaria TaxID=6604 RepID=UPI0022E05D81|nr:receptor-type tyrosine-protein phosphatase epsilon-like [Mya arenaria]
MLASSVRSSVINRRLSVIMIVLARLCICKSLLEWTVTPYLSSLGKGDKVEKMFSIPRLPEWLEGRQEVVFSFSDWYFPVFWDIEDTSLHRKQEIQLTLFQCPGDTYGTMCHSSCSKKCKYGCNKVDGECNCCVDGWAGQFCDDKEEQKFTISEVAVVAGGSIGETGNPVTGIAHQSSIYQNCSADKAFDGKKNFSEEDEELPTCTCSVTDPEKSHPWWEMDFKSMHLISSIIVTGRSALVGVDSEQKAFPSGAVAGGVIGALCVVAVIVGAALFFYRRILQKPQTIETSKTYENVEFNTQTQTVSYSSKHSPAKTAEIEQTTDTDVNYYVFENNIPGIQIHHLWDYIRENNTKGCQHFNDEFAKLPTGLVHKHEVAGREEYKGKNRYREMYAYDHSRVPLQKERDGDCNYINASYIDGYCKARKFIASQGPTNNMIDDFWRMVWQENAEKIVMLTNLIEMAAVKCLQYWPEMDQTCSFGGIDISITAVKKFRDYEIRTLIAKKVCSTREIQQYHFKAWPDKDVPDNGWCLVEFLNAVETQSSNAPIIVHCSAGVGRTGTFVALDNLVEQAKTEECVKPLEMVKALRQQRVNMVQTKDQYIYLHKALAEALLMGTDHIWHRQFENVHPFMIATETGKEQSRLVKQFQLIEKSLTNEADQVQNEPSFYGNNTFLMCKSPCEEQLEEFWSLVEEQHVITIIMLTTTSSQAHQTCEYMGGIGDGKDEEYLTTIKQFQIGGWTENEPLPPIQNMLDCLDAVRKWQPHLAENRPVLIHCETGHERSGLIAVLLNELHRMEKTRGQINIVETVKTMKQRNRDIIPNTVQYKFIYDSLLEKARNITEYENI